MDTSIHAHFSILVDPRVERTRQHKLIDILVIALSAVICGTEHFTEGVWEGQRSVVSHLSGVA